MQLAKLRTFHTGATGFNPHPPGRVGATALSDHDLTEGERVSILTHLVGWVQHSAVGFVPSAVWSFQSSPTWSGGCNQGRGQSVEPTSKVSILTHLVGWVQHPLRSPERP